MTVYNNGGKGDLFAMRASDGLIINPGWDPTHGWGLTLPDADTYMFPLGNEKRGPTVETVMHALSAEWPSGITGTMTINVTNFPRTTTGNDQGGSDVADNDTTAAWQLLDITNTGSIYAVATGTGTMTKYTCVITAGAGGAAWNIPELGFRRMRLKFVATVGGFLRVNGCCKLGS